MTADNFNKLTGEETELLAFLAGECSEVIKEITKAFQHGLDSPNPYEPTAGTNMVRISRELGHLGAAVELLKQRRIIDETVMIGAKGNKLANVGRRLHHTTVTPAIGSSLVVSATPNPDTARPTLEVDEQIRLY